MNYWPYGVHVDELGMGDIDCLFCGMQILDEAFYAGEFGGHLCDDCVKAYVDRETVEARQFAEANCRIAVSLPAYDDENVYRCTPEEYEMGDRESNTPTAYFTKCRHDYTNYDELIRDIPRNSDQICDQLMYEAICTKIHRLLLDAIEEHHPNVDCSSWGENTFHY